MTGASNPTDQGPHGGPLPDQHLPENSQENLDRKLDHAVKETFPTSDPVSVTITKGGAIDYDDNGNPISSASNTTMRDAKREAEALLTRVKSTAARWRRKLRPLPARRTARAPITRVQQANGTRKPSATIARVRKLFVSRLRNTHCSRWSLVLGLATSSPEPSRAVG